MTYASYGVAPVESFYQPICIEYHSINLQASYENELGNILTFYNQVNRRKVCLCLQRPKLDFAA